MSACDGVSSLAVRRFFFVIAGPWLHRVRDDARSALYLRPVRVPLAASAVGMRFSGHLLR